MIDKKEEYSDLMKPENNIREVKQNLFKAVMGEENDLSLKEKIAIVQEIRFKYPVLIQDPFTKSLIRRILMTEEKYHELVLGVDMTPLPPLLRKETGDYGSFEYRTDHIDKELMDVLNFAFNSEGIGVIEGVEEYNSSSFFDKSVICLSGISIKPRYDVEYNHWFKQFVVGVIIRHVTDDGHKLYLMLQNTIDGDTRLPSKKTIVQGHVAYAPDAQTSSLMEWLKLSAVRELKEETIILNGEWDIKPEDLHIGNVIYDQLDVIGREHIGFIFYLDIFSDELFNSIRSGEPDKHDVYIHELGTESLESIEQFDRWSQMCLGMEIKRQLTE